MSASPPISGAEEAPTASSTEGTSLTLMASSGLSSVGSTLTSAAGGATAVWDAYWNRASVETPADKTAEWESGVRDNALTASQIKEATYLQLTTPVDDTQPIEAILQNPGTYTLLDQFFKRIVDLEGSAGLTAFRKLEAPLSNDLLIDRCIEHARDERTQSYLKLLKDDRLSFEHASTRLRLNIASGYNALVHHFNRLGVTPTTSDNPSAPPEGLQPHEHLPLRISIEEVLTGCLLFQWFNTGNEIGPPGRSLDLGADIFALASLLTGTTLPEHHQEEAERGAQDLFRRFILQGSLEHIDQFISMIGQERAIELLRASIEYEGKVLLYGEYALRINEKKIALYLALFLMGCIDLSYTPEERVRFVECCIDREFSADEVLYLGKNILADYTPSGSGWSLPALGWGASPSAQEQPTVHNIESFISNATGEQLRDPSEGNNVLLCILSSGKAKLIETFFERLAETCGETAVNEYLANTTTNVPYSETADTLGYKKSGMLLSLFADGTFDILYGTSEARDVYTKLALGMELDRSEIDAVYHETLNAERTTVGSFLENLGTSS